MSDQTQFAKALLDPQAPVPEGIIQPDGRPATKRFGVYRNNVVVSLIDALSQAFPVIKKLVGDQFFEAMAGVYVRSHPPQTPMMMFYGGDFPEFLEGFEPVQNLAYLPDMARLEHARRTAYHAADDTIISADALAQVPQDALVDVRFDLHASVHLVPSPHPIFSIWRLNATEDKTPVAAQSEDVLVARPEQEVEMRVLPAGGTHFITALHMGRSLGDAAEFAAAHHEDFDLSTHIGGLLASRIIRKINLN